MSLEASWGGSYQVGSEGAGRTGETSDVKEVRYH